MARRYPTSPFHKMVDAVGWAAFDGPVEVLSKDVAGISVKDSYLKDSSALPRVLAHDGWADHNEKQMIAGDGGTWRGENVPDPLEQTLNKDAGGQGGEFRRLCAQAAKQERAEAKGATYKAREARRKAEAWPSWPSMRCEHPGCTKSAQGATKLCKLHGGGKRCEHPGCTKSAIGATKLCVLHGGGKR